MRALALLTTGSQFTFWSQGTPGFSQGLVQVLDGFRQGGDLKVMLLPQAVLEGREHPELPRSMASMDRDRSGFPGWSQTTHMVNWLTQHTYLSGMRPSTSRRTPPDYC